MSALIECVHGAQQMQIDRSPPKQMGTPPVWARRGRIHAMATELPVSEPIKTPDARRPAMLASLPAWVERLNAAVRLELQMTPDGKSFEKADVLVLPTELMPTTEQR